MTRRALSTLPNKRARRSFVMLAVLVVMLSAMLVATSMLYVGQTEASGASGSADAAQLRALLWSGAQAVMSRLNDQRERILLGDVPVLDPQYVIYETSRRAGVVRLLPVGPGGTLLCAEAGKLDLNHVDAKALARTGLVDAATAESIIARRDERSAPLQSVSDLLEAPGVTVETLYGSISNLLVMDAARQELGARSSDARVQAAAPARALADVVTVFSVEPNVQYTGRLRINLNVAWSDELARAVEERFGVDAVNALKQVFESGVKLDSDTALVRAMLAYKTPLDQWSAIFDAFTTDAEEHHFGRLDLNAAPREALQALPGVTPEQAAQIVDLRQELADRERATIAWPVVNQIIPPEAYEQLAERITARCWTYRVRIAAGELDADAPDGPLLNPHVQELVIDLADGLPRIAYLRDVTLMQDAALIAMDAARGHATEAESAAVTPLGASSSEHSATSAPSAGPTSAPATSAGGDSSPTGDDGGGAGDDHRGRRVGRWTNG